jgi:hypothetical protein
MERKIVPVVHFKSLNQPESDFAYWQKQSYEARLAALEEIRSEYQAWIDSQQKDKTVAQPGFQRVYRIIKR